MTYWLFTIHNIVNLKLNKKKANFIDVVDYYEKRRANQTDIVCKTKMCNCEKCNKNFDFVTKTKLKYHKITNNFIKELIKCEELSS